MTPPTELTWKKKKIIRELNSQLEGNKQVFAEIINFLKKGVGQP